MKSTVLAAIAVVIIVIVVGGAFLATGSLSPHTTTVTTSQQGTTVTSVSTVTTTASTSSIMSSSNSSTSSNSTNSISLVRIGYFANLNHAPAILGLSDGDFQSYLGPTTTIKTYLFTAGPTEMTALLAGQLDMAYVGPSSAITPFIQSNGTALKIVAGVASGGAVFVVSNNSNITSVANFTGKTFAAPQLGNTQDIALRSFLLRNHYIVGTNVTVVDTSNANILTLMTQGKIQGAWVPEPTASELIFEANAHVFLDERSIWPNESFSTAELVVRTAFLTAHPDVVKKIIEADVNDTIWINANPTKVFPLIDAGIANLTSTTPLNSTIFNNATQYLSFTYDPLEASVQQQAQNAYELGFLGTTAPNLNGLFDLTLLNQVLQQDGLPQVSN
jgi:NitT/TauT family transport system substrate-binding protein